MEAGSSSDRRTQISVNVPQAIFGLDEQNILGF